MSQDIFHQHFVAQPYWWDFYNPVEGPSEEIPASSDVAIVGGGYAGLSTALELARNGVNVVVLEANLFGYGASTRNGGGVSGGVNVGKTLSGGKVDYRPGERESILGEAARAFGFIEDFIECERIDCSWIKPGRFVGAWTPRHFRKQEASIASLNEFAQSGAFMVPKERQRGEIGSDLYHGGMVISRSALINPALLYKAMLGLCKAAGVRLCANALVNDVVRDGAQWTLQTSRGDMAAEQVVIATNGYTGDVTPQFKRRLVPIASNIIVTEELPDGLAADLFPTGRMINDTPRIRSYYRLTPDGRRVLYGGRGKFGSLDTKANAIALHKMMVERLPALKNVKVTHAWNGNVAFTLDATPHVGTMNGIHFILGCNGSGVAMMSYLGHYVGRKIAGQAPATSSFEREFPDHVLYNGNPWFLPLMGRWFKLIDRAEKLVS